MQGAINRMPHRKLSMACEGWQQVRANQKSPKANKFRLYNRSLTFGTGTLVNPES